MSSLTPSLCGFDGFISDRLNWRQQVDKLIHKDDRSTFAADDLINQCVPRAIGALIERSYLPRPERIARDVFLSISRNAHQNFWSGDVDTIEYVYRKLMAEKMVESNSSVCCPGDSLKRTITETAMAVENLIDVTNQFYNSIQNQQTISYPTKNNLSLPSASKLPSNDSATTVNDINTVSVAVSSIPQVDYGNASNIGKNDSRKPISLAATTAALNGINDQVNLPQIDQEVLRDAKANFTTLPNVSMIRSDTCTKLGKVRVIKLTGCTVRNDVDIDNSTEVHKLKHLDEAYFDQMTLLPAIPNETVAIYRLHIYFNVRDNDDNAILKSGWASLKGRTFDDMLPILEIVMPVEKVTEKAPLAPVTTISSSSNVTSSSSSSSNISKPGIFCPFCSVDITLYDLPAREHHVNICGQSLISTLPTGTAKRGKENDRVAQQLSVAKKSKAVAESCKSACPICARMVLSTLFEAHVNECLNN